MGPLVARIVAWTAVVAATLACAIEVLGALPAPTLPLLAFAVAVPEVASRALVICVVLLVAIGLLARGRLRVVGVSLASIACVLALVPLVQYPQARIAADAELRAFDATAQPGPALARPAAIRVTANVPVHTRDGATLGFDVYHAPTAGPRPTIVTIYGGAWLFGKRQDMAEIDRDLAAHGYTVIAIDYRHAPKHRFPVERDDVQDALATIAHNAERFDVDPDRVAIFGRSAGAELALLAGYAPSLLHVRGVVAYYAPTDLVDGYNVPPRPDPADVRGILRAYLGTPPNGNASGYRAASPIEHVRAGLPPTFLIIGDRDLLVRPEQQRALRDALRAHHDRVVAIELPWSNHAFDALPGGLGGTLARRETLRFLAATLRTSS